MTLTTEFETSLNALLPPSPINRLGVAVSGGGDSIALLTLARDWAAKNDVTLFAVTVDHRLRSVSADEANSVAAHCDSIGVPHKVLQWTGWDGAGNLQNQARLARMSLIADWAREAGVKFVATGHSQDDQAETVLMRLARGAGVDGLSGIPAKRCDGDLCWLRPLLAVSREDLRGFLRARGIGWVEDPSNDDPTYDRVKIRQAMSLLAPLGVSAKGLAETARRLSQARQVLDLATQIAAKTVAKSQFGNVTLEIEALRGLAAETRRRLLAHTLKWVSGSIYAPRASALAALETAVLAEEKSTLSGCVVIPFQGAVVIGREHSAVVEARCKPTEIWDQRWSLSGPASEAMIIAALGETGLRLCPDWRDTGLPRAVLLGSPAIWRGRQLIAAPVAGFSNGWQASLVKGENDFFTSILSH